MVSVDFVLPGFITLLTFINVLKSEQILDKQNEDFDFDGLPGVSYEFKVEVNAGDEQCFHQKIAQGARLYVSFEVSENVIGDLPEVQIKGISIVMMCGV